MTQKDNKNENPVSVDNDLHIKDEVYDKDNVEKEQDRKVEDIVDVDNKTEDKKDIKGSREEDTTVIDKKIDDDPVEEKDYPDDSEESDVILRERQKYKKVDDEPLD